MRRCIAGGERFHRRLIAVSRLPLVIRRLIWGLHLNIPWLRRHAFGTYGISSVARLQTELGFPCHVIATGGLATVIAPLSNTIREVDDTLTLTGLRLLWERNQNA